MDLDARNRLLVFVSDKDSNQPAQIHRLARMFAHCKVSYWTF